MNYTKLFSISLFALVFFSACSQEREDESLASIILGEHTLKFEETLTSDDNTFSMTFAEVVSDSRCPELALCEFEGFAEVKFIFEIDELAYSLVLTDHIGYPAKGIGAVAGYTINLLEVAPYPQLNESPIPNEDYIVKFTIEE